MIYRPDGGEVEMVSEEDWLPIQETLYLTSIPGMQESIVEGMNAPLEESNKELDW